MKALARQSDVKPASVRVEMKDGGRVVFEARQGRSLDVGEIHACLKETRLSGKPPGRTRSRVLYLELTVLGQVVRAGKEVLLKVNGTKQVFRLGDDPGPRDNPLEQTDFQRLEQALAKGRKV